MLLEKGTHQRGRLATHRLMKAAALPLLGVDALPFSRSVSLSSRSAIIRSFQLGDSVNPLLVLLLARPAVEEMNEFARFGFVVAILDWLPAELHRIKPDD